MQQIEDSAIMDNPFDVINYLEENWTRNYSLCIAWLFHVKSSSITEDRVNSYREGISWILNYKGNTPDKELSTEELFTAISSYNSWEDCLDIVCNSHIDKVIEIFSNTLQIDMESPDNSSCISSSCPIPGTELDLKHSFYKRLSSSMNIKEEIFMSSVIYPLLEQNDYQKFLIMKGKWEKVNYKSITIHDIQKYKKDFYRNDRDRFNAFVKSVNKAGKVYLPLTVYYHYQSIINRSELSSEINKEEKSDIVLVVDCSSSCIGIPLAVSSSMIDNTGQKSWIPFTDNLSEIDTVKTHTGMLDLFYTYRKRVSISIKRLLSLYRGRTFVVITNRSPTKTYYDLNGTIIEDQKIIHWNVSNEDIMAVDVVKGLIYYRGYDPFLYDFLSRYSPPTSVSKYIKMACTPN